MNAYSMCVWMMCMITNIHVFQGVFEFWWKIHQRAPEWINFFCWRKQIFEPFWIWQRISPFFIWLSTQQQYLVKTKSIKVPNVIYGLYNTQNDATLCIGIENENVSQRSFRFDYEIFKSNKYESCMCDNFFVYTFCICVYLTYPLKGNSTTNSSSDK